MEQERATAVKEERIGKSGCKLFLYDDLELAEVDGAHGPDGREPLGDRGEGLDDDGAGQMEGDAPPLLAVVELLEEQAPEVEPVEGHEAEVCTHGYPQRRQGLVDQEERDVDDRHREREDPHYP